MTRIARACSVACTVASLTASLLAGCGGAGNPLDNPDSVANPTGSVSGQKLSFAYFQYCINPILNTDLQININGNVSTNKCASSGCHDSVTGTGGAFRLLGSAPIEALTQTAETIRLSSMYKNFYSAQGSTVVGSVPLSNLLNKPRVFRVLHAGGLIFLDETDPNVKFIEYWITHPMPKTGDEFSNSDGMFTNGVPRLGECKSQ
jgi:hypothetical protein